MLNTKTYDCMNRLLFAALIFSHSTFSQMNDYCDEMIPFCPNPGLTFTAQASGTSAMDVQPTNNYDCLLSTPSASWFYCVIDQAGDINMNLFAAQDIDYIIYGPFSDTIAAKLACGNMGNGLDGANIIDCSYSATNNEYPKILNAQVGV